MPTIVQYCKFILMFILVNKYDNYKSSNSISVDDIDIIFEESKSTFGNLLLREADISSKITSLELRSEENN